MLRGLLLFTRRIGYDNRKAGERYHREQGRYPVIFLTFKDVKYNAWEETKVNLYSAIQTEYRRYISLLASDRIADVDKQYVEKMFQGTLDAALWAGTFFNLALLLDLRYQPSVITMHLQKGFTMDSCWE